MGLSSILHAQNTLQFKGIPVEGDVKTFISQLQAQGAKLDDTDDNLYLFVDNFAGVSDCLIAVVHSDGTIVEVIVYFLSAQTSWYKLKDRFVTLEERYIKKYGKPSDSFKVFGRPYEEGDGNEMIAVEEKMCAYLSAWHVDNGTIWMEIDALKCVAIHYENKNGAQLRRQHRENLINADI